MTPEEIKKRLADRYMTELMFHDEAKEISEKQDRVRARVEAITDPDPVLKYMLDHNLWLSREVWMLRTYGNHPPEPWTAELESTVPAPFQLGEEGAE
jgi:hypothetical protein